MQAQPPPLFSSSLPCRAWGQHEAACINPRTAFVRSLGTQLPAAVAACCRGGNTARTPPPATPLQIFVLCVWLKFASVADRDEVGQPAPERQPA